MRRIVVILAVLLVAVPAATSDAALNIIRVVPAAGVPKALIVGRAVCADATWMLVDSTQLVQLPASGTPIVRPVTGLATTDRPWGLACLTDGTLWTMAAWRTLARVDPNGQIKERLDLSLARAALFGAGDRLLFQQAPPVVGTPALMTSPPRQPYAVKRWPGLTTPKGPSNLANCGIGVKDLVPCWLVTATQFVISDGATSRAVDVAPLQSTSIDRDAPIRDVALAADDYFWVIGGGFDANLGRPAGVRIFRGRAGTGELLSLDLVSAARLVVRASVTSCLLLGVDGSLIEVGVTR